MAGDRYWHPNSPTVFVIKEDATASWVAIARSYADTVAVFVHVVVAASIGWYMEFDIEFPTVTITEVFGIEGGCCCGDGRKDEESCSEMHFERFKGEKD
jgi:hypothetical protein